MKEFWIDMVKKKVFFFVDFVLALDGVEHYINVHADLKIIAALKS